MANEIVNGKEITTIDIQTIIDSINNKTFDFDNFVDLSVVSRYVGDSLLALTMLQKEDNRTISMSETYLKYNNKEKRAELYKLLQLNENVILAGLSAINIKFLAEFFDSELIITVDDDEMEEIEFAPKKILRDLYCERSAKYITYGPLSKEDKAKVDKFINYREQYKYTKLSQEFKSHSEIFYLFEKLLPEERLLLENGQELTFEKHKKFLENRKGDNDE